VKICVISTPVFQCPPPGYSGLEHLAWLCAEGFASRGHEVSLVAPDGSRANGCEIIQSGPPGGWGEREAYSNYWHRLPEFDVILDHTWQKWSYVLKQEGKLKSPVLGVMHAPVNTMYQTLPMGVEKPCFVCISKDQANHFEAFHGRQALVCHNGVDPDFYSPMSVKRTRRFLFLARFSSIKGADLAIQACKQAKVDLDLIGDDTITGEPHYLEEIRSWCDGKKINLVGPATRGECVHWFSRAHCLLHPNLRFREPFGLAPVEAQLCGTPVIAWDFGAMRETLHPDHCRLVRSMDDLVEAITKMKGSAVTQEARDACREWGKQFSVNRMIDRYLELMQTAITTGGW
jgi:glycosyltransferase involved in cell wall biosynthesis